MPKHFAVPPIGTAPLSILPAPADDWTDADDAELAYADMLADDGADDFEVRAACRRARSRRRS